MPSYTRERGKGWVNEEGRASSMLTGATRRRRGKKSYLRVHDAEECERECTATDPCVAFTFIPMIHRCDLKAEADAVRLEDVGGAISGKLEGERPAPPGSPGRVQNSTICLPCLPGQIGFTSLSLNPPHSLQHRGWREVLRAQSLPSKGEDADGVRCLVSP